MKAPSSAAVQKKFRDGTRLFLLSAGLLGFASATFASYQATASSGSIVIGSTSTPGDVSYSVSGPATSSATASFSSSPVASINAVASVSNPLGTTALGIGGDMTYSFEVAATPFTNVPIDFFGVFSTYLAASGLGQQSSESFTLTATQPTSASYSSFQALFTGNCGATICYAINTLNTSVALSQSDIQHLSGSFQGTLGMLTGSDGKVSGSVQIRASAGARVIGGTATATSYIDPSLHINAAFLAANPGATLTLTAGVGNATAAVPEPGSYVLMLAGLTALALGAHRKRIA